MKSQLSEDTDEEDCDDPIKLFESDVNAVYFGTRTHTHVISDTESRSKFEKIANNDFHQLKKNLKQILQSGTTSECDISPSCVKLVDFRKFPWYFRKYTQQILHKTNLNKHSDSDQDIDIIDIEDDLSDCFIIEDRSDDTDKIIDDQILNNTVKLIQSKHQANKIKLETMKRRRDENELRKALSIKNKIKIDLKRNKGLVGMKIEQKRNTNATLDVKTDRENEIKEVKAKQKDVMTGEKYISAADKILSHVGTQLIPILEEKESNSICQFKINNERQDLVVGKQSTVTSTSPKNVPVQFNISKISEKLIENLMIKKMNGMVSNKSLLKDPKNTLNIVNKKELSSKITTTEKLPNSPKIFTSHVKDVKKTNKYKNDQIKIKNKASHSSLIGLLVSKQSNENIKELICKKRKRHKDGTQSKVAELKKTPCKNIEKQKREPKLPILHCSIVSKKPEHEVSPKSNKSDTNSNLPKEPDNLNQIVNKPANLNNCNIMQNLNQPKNVVPKIASGKKLLDIHTKQALQKDSCLRQDKSVSQVSDIHAKSSNVWENDVKNCNDVNDPKTNDFQNTQIISSSQNKTRPQDLLHNVHQDNVNKHSVNAVSVTNPTPKAAIQNNKRTVCNNNVSTTNAVTPANGPKSSDLSNQFSDSINFLGSPFPIHNGVPSKKSRGNIPNNRINVPVQNRYASAIILKPNNQLNFPFVKYCETPVQATAPQKPKDMPVLGCINSQRPYPQYYQSAPSGRHQNSYPSSANSVPNQFHSPKPQMNQQLSNSMRDFYRGCWFPQNLTPPPPPPLPGPPTKIIRRNGYDANQSKGCANLKPPSASVTQHPQSAFCQNPVNTLQTQNSSIIGMNNDGLVKKINIVAQPVAKQVDTEKGTIKIKEVRIPEIITPLGESEVIATKTEMFEEIDKLSFADNDFKRTNPASIINDNREENTFDVAIMSKKPGEFETLKLTVNQKIHPKRTEQANGYSPPILPIPTFQKVLEQVSSDSQTQNATPHIAVHTKESRLKLKNEPKSMRKREPNHAWTIDKDNKRKDEAKKISLEEYKKRNLKNDCKSEHNKKLCKEKNKFNYSGKRPNSEFKYRENVDYSTETDLGYDSDSTLVL